MARKTNNTGLLKSNLSFISSRGKGVQALLFVLVFGVLGGTGYLVYNTFAYSALPGLTYCKNNYTNLRVGSNGSCVATVQRFLKRTGTYYVGSACPSKYRPSKALVDDGAFGPITNQYVKCYQYVTMGGAKAADGIVGPKTYTKMIQECTSSATYMKKYGVSCTSYAS